MKITIRPAPHSKECAYTGSKFCNLHKNQPEKCETECPAGRCCEMKHCWEVGEKLRDILISRGHKVKMADKKYNKGYPDTKANDDMKKALKELLAWGSELHIALHTNSASAGVRGVRIGYPALENNKDEPERCRRSERLAKYVVTEIQKIYPLHQKVLTTTYNFYEANVPKVPAIYIEGAFANSNVEDGKWWHENMDEIATAYADGIEAWIAAEKEEANFVAYKAKVKTKTGGGASIWSDNKKSKRVVLVEDGEIVTVTGNADAKGFVPVEYKGKTGVFDSQYLVKIEEPETPVKPEAKPDNTDLLAKLQEIRKLTDEAIALASKV